WQDIAAGAKSAFSAVTHGITDADHAAASAKSLLQMLSAFNPTLGGVASTYLATVKARTASGDFANVHARSSTVPANYASTLGLPEDFGLGVKPPSAEEWAKAGDAAAGAINKITANAREAARALAAI